MKQEISQGAPGQADDFRPANPVITVITVAFNAEKTIEGTIRSVLDQSYDNVEYIIVDGGSADGTVEVIKRFESDIDHWVSEKDRGIYDAMNKGLKMATGEIVGFLNADDLYADATVLKQVAQAFDDDRIDACYADLVYVSQDDKRVVRYWRSNQFRKGQFTRGWCPPHPTFYVRKSAIDRLGGFDTSFRLAADAELMIRYLEVNDLRPAYVPEVWVRMRVGGETNKNWKNVVRQNLEIFNALKKNHLRVSYAGFLSSKLISRIGQYLFANKAGA